MQVYSTDDTQDANLPLVSVCMLLSYCPQNREGSGRKSLRNSRTVMAEYDRAMTKCKPYLKTSPSLPPPLSSYLPPSLPPLSFSHLSLPPTPLSLPPQHTCLAEPQVFCRPLVMCCIHKLIIRVTCDHLLQNVPPLWLVNEEVVDGC